MRFGNVYKSFIYKVFTTHIFILQKKVSSSKIWKTVTYTEYYAHFFCPCKSHFEAYCLSLYYNTVIKTDLN